MKVITSIISIVLVAVLATCVVSCKESTEKAVTRTKTNINKDWTYLENNTKEIKEAQKATNWKQIDLPYSWNGEDVVDAEPGYRRSGSWYKKELDIQEVSPAIDYQLYFEGSNVTTTAYVNGKEVGNHVGGYVGFKFDISKDLKKGKNEILVRVDNSYNPEIIPSQKNDFFIYGGITRDVWLLKLPKTHIEGLHIKTPLVSETEASLEVDVALQNFNDKKSNLQLKGVLKDPKGQIVSTKIISLNKPETTLKFNAIENPELWDTENPNRYILCVSLVNEQGDVLDEVNDKVGFRWFEFKDYGPFYLNGKRLLLRGTHRHEEAPGFGAAMSNDQQRTDIKTIKEMGANFVRLAHYPQDPEVYEMCDSLGILVWDELPWSRGGVGNDLWKKNTKRLLKEMITQNQNHPSIIIWSLGNEIYWLPDFEDGDNPNKINTFLKELNDEAHQLDPSRKTAIRKYYEGANIVDVFSPSIWSGWYSGSYKSYQKALDKYKKEYPHFLHAEYGGASNLGRHKENPITGEGVIKSDGWEEEIVQTKVKNIAQIGDWSENYIVNLFDWYLRISETDSTFVGNAQWALKDFATPLRPENDIPYINQKGVMDRAGNPKDAFYVFKSYWSKDPFTYIESHTWTERQGPSNLPRIISVFSNCSEVEFFFNGKNMGTKQKDIYKFPASGLTWEVTFKEGHNTMKSIGKTDEGEEVIDTLSVNYRYVKNGSAEALKLSAKKLENGNYLVSAIAVDQNGLRCLDYEDKVYFQCLEGGQTIKNQGTMTGSEIIAMSNGKAAIEVVPDETASFVEMSVLNQSFKGTYLKIPLQ
ncbi:glycoside hydrolase family 2 protein [Yeosuana marina]|uniref:glycoside hydrolase family 2 protein n=1 Tax=Yeosuana marina TaxID=1565536 RepID=UPI0014216D0C|nr:glycoside hydrolase family 2 TIM barrel-domain containing protein [Yeosuana marina]